jgi:hypothetical protein
VSRRPAIPDEEREKPLLVLSETLFGGKCTPRLHRLCFFTLLCVSLFPFSVFQALAEFSISSSYCIKRLFNRIWPDASTRGIESIAHATILVPASLRWFSLVIYCIDRNCLYSLHTSYSVSFFHRLQELCVSLAGLSVQEHFVEYGTEPDSCRRPSFSHRCWRTLFAGLSSLKTLGFGDGAAELLVGALHGGAVIPTSSAVTTTTTTTATTTRADNGNAAWRGFLSGSLQWVIVSWRSPFSTRILWDCIHYAYARPAE